MSYLTINGNFIKVQGIRELKPGISIEEAAQKTKKNGIDEIYFKCDGKSYLAYGDSLNISELAKRQIPRVSFNGRPADIITYEDEINSVAEGIKVGALRGMKETANGAINAVKNMIDSIGPTSSLMLGGGVLGLTALSIWRGGAGNAGSALSSGFLGEVGAMVSRGIVGGLKVVAIGGAIGLGISGIAGAISGAMEARSTEKDYSTIAAVTYEGSTPTNTSMTRVSQLLSPDLLVRKYA